MDVSLTVKPGAKISASSGVFTTSVTGSAVDVTNLSVTIKTTGRPVYVGLIADGTSGSGNGNEVSARCTSGGWPTISVHILRGATKVASIGSPSLFFGTPPTGIIEIASGPGAFCTIDTVSAGTYTYKVQVELGGSSSLASVVNCKLIAYQL